MRASLFGLVVVLLVAAVGFRQAGHEAQKTIGDIRGVADVLERATGDQRPADPWFDSLAAQCSAREQLLAAVTPLQSLARASRRAHAIAAIQRAHLRAVDRLGVPQSHRAEARSIRRRNARQLRILEEVALAAERGDLVAAQRRAQELRLFAGESNAEFLRLGLPECLVRASAMPL